MKFPTNFILYKFFVALWITELRSVKKELLKKTVGYKQKQFGVASSYFLAL